MEHSGTPYGAVDYLLGQDRTAGYVCIALRVALRVMTEGL